SIKPWTFRCRWACLMFWRMDVHTSATESRLRARLPELDHRRVDLICTVVGRRRLPHHGVALLI
ncbi:hypothetical protein ACVBEG_26720, partial [Pseudomonas sp. GG8]